jgi:hypothetical protein
MQEWKSAGVMHVVLQLLLQMQKQLLKRQPLTMTPIQKAAITRQSRMVNCQAQLQRALAMDEQPRQQIKLWIVRRRCSS